MWMWNDVIVVINASAAYTFKVIAHSVETPL